MADSTFSLPPDEHRVTTSEPIPHEAPTRVVIVGAGPGGYESALVAVHLGAEVTLVTDGPIGGNAVATDVVPSKSLVAAGDVFDVVGAADRLGVTGAGRSAASGSREETPGARGRGEKDEPDRDGLGIDLARLNARIRYLAESTSHDIRARLERDGVRVLDGRARLVSSERLVVGAVGGRDGEIELDADIVLLATGARPRVLPGARPDGERILDWTQLYELTELPAHLIVVGSGVTGAEFASAYHALGAPVTLVSSRDQVLPGSDVDAAALVQRTFTRRGIDLRSGVRAVSARRTDAQDEGERVVVELDDGTSVSGSHVLVAVGSVPATTGLGLEEAGIELRESGHIEVDRVSRTRVRGVYAAGDCTGVLPLASVAAAQGRIAMHHALGESVTPLLTRTIASAVFTSPEIATIGWGAHEAEHRGVDAEVLTFPLSPNPRAKMQGIEDGFVKLVAKRGSGTLVGAVVVAPRASESIHALAVAVGQQMSLDDLAQTTTVYPSLSGSIAEAARTMSARMR